jgi:hypothetical protein
MSKILRNLLLAASVVVAGQAAAEVTFYENDGFSGRSFTSNQTIWNLDNTGFNDRASSAIIRGGSWEICSDARLEGQCVVLGAGEYPSLRSLGMNDRISSAREVGRYGSADRYSGRNDTYARNYGDNRYDYRGDGWRYDRWEDRWERY